MLFMECGEASFLYICAVQNNLLEVLVIRINEIRAMQNDALNEKLNDLMFELFAEKRKIASTGVQSKVVKIKEIRRTIARIKTVFRERGVKN